MGRPCIRQATMVGTRNDSLVILSWHLNRQHGLKSFRQRCMCWTSYRFATRQLTSFVTPGGNLISPLKPNGLLPAVIARRKCDASLSRIANHDRLPRELTQDTRGSGHVPSSGSPLMYQQPTSIQTAGNENEKLLLSTARTAAHTVNDSKISQTFVST